MTTQSHAVSLTEQSHWMGLVLSHEHVQAAGAQAGPPAAPAPTLKAAPAPPAPPPQAGAGTSRAHSQINRSAETNSCEGPGPSALDHYRR